MAIESMETTDTRKSCLVCNYAQRYTKRPNQRTLRMQCGYMGVLGDEYTKK